MGSVFCGNFCLEKSFKTGSDLFQFFIDKRYLFNFLSSVDTSKLASKNSSFLKILINKFLFVAMPFTTDFSNANMSFFTASFIPKSLPSDLAGKLLNFYLSYLENNEAFHDKVEFKILPTCLTPSFYLWEDIFLDKAFLNKNEINLLKKELTKVTREAFNKPKFYLKQINQLKNRNIDIISSNLDHLEKAR